MESMEVRPTKSRKKRENKKYPYKRMNQRQLKMENKNE